MLISNYRYNNIARQCEKYRLATLTTGIDIDFRFAVSRGQTALYSIMAKTVGLVPDSAVNGALSYYIAEDARLTLTDFIVDHLGVVTVVIAVVLLVIFLLMLQNMRAVRRARRLISATENDDLTGLYNRNFFLQYADRMYREHPENPMDDFGTGYSSLNMLSAMPIDVLKMDRAFIRNIEHDDKDIQLVALILDIARNLKIPVVAEGVETEEQMKLLKELGCELVQGYYFSKPLHATDFENLYIRPQSEGRAR